MTSRRHEKSPSKPTGRRCRVFVGGHRVDRRTNYTTRCPPWTTRGDRLGSLLLGVPARHINVRPYRRSIRGRRSAVRTGTSLCIRVLSLVPITLAHRSDGDVVTSRFSPVSGKWSADYKTTVGQTATERHREGCRVEGRNRGGLVRPTSENCSIRLICY